jgi:hypothetical protein
VRRNFDKLPRDLRNKLLFELSENEAAAEYVALAITENFDKIPDELRNKLLLKLSLDNEAAKYVALAVAENFDIVPGNPKNLLDELRDDFESLIENLARRGSENRMKVIKIISNASLKIDKTFALRVLEDFCRDENEEVRKKSENLYWIVFLGIKNYKQWLR